MTVPRSLARSSVVLAASALLLAAPARAQPAQARAATQLHDAIQLFNNLEDERAATLLRELLRHAPKAQLAGRAHLYLGLVALNVLDVEGARAEFKRAMAIDPTIELPLDASPKARVVFSQAQGDTGQGSAGPSSVVLVVPGAKSGPSGAAPPDLLGVGWTPPPPPIPAYVVGGVSVAALATGLTFGLLSNGTLASARSAPLASQAEQLGAQVGTQRLIADIGFGAALVAGVTAVILYLNEKGPPPPPPAAGPNAPFAWGGGT